jgi:hypothetical protein
MLAMHIDRNSNAADLRSSFLRSISTGSSAPAVLHPTMGIWEAISCSSSLAALFHADNAPGQANTV